MIIPVHIYLARSIPYEKVDDIRLVNLVTDVRKFTESELNFPMNKNYSRYVHLNRSYFCYIVNASEKDSFGYLKWSKFGNRKGFLNLTEAVSEEEKLKQLDLDVFTTAATPAIGSMNRFLTDPIISIMKNWSDMEIVKTMIHEHVHSELLTGDLEFDEQLAKYIGYESVLLFMKWRYGEDSGQYRRALDYYNNNRNYIKFLQELIIELEALYSQNISRETILEEKELIIVNAKKKFNEEYYYMFTDITYRFFSRMEINNAYLNEIRLYNSGDNFLEELMQNSGKDLKELIAAAKKINKKDSDPKKQLVNLLLNN